MKRIIVTVIFVFSMALASFAQDREQPSIPIPFTVHGSVGSSVFRSPELVPVQGYYEPFTNTVYVSFCDLVGSNTLESVSSPSRSNYYDFLVNTNH